jgi:adenine-specific DNA methylase
VSLGGVDVFAPAHSAANGETTRFPQTRYQGSKAKIVEWIWEKVRNLSFDTCLDAFGGTGAVSYRLKQARKVVTYNDLLQFNGLLGRAIIENSSTRLSPERIEWCLERRDIEYRRFVEDYFSDIYFTDNENAWIDQTIGNIQAIDNRYEHALAFFALSQACLTKRPYNLFHRKNLYMRLADVPRSFGNKTAWDAPFAKLFRKFAAEANASIFDNGRCNAALVGDVMRASSSFDLIYMDPPYTSRRRNSSNYLDFYHFLEGLAVYDDWADRIDWRSKHLRFQRQPSEWTTPRKLAAAFDRLFERFESSILVLSYRSDGFPSVDDLAQSMRRVKPNVTVERLENYKYALSKNTQSSEILLIGR